MQERNLPPLYITKAEKKNEKKKQGKGTAAVEVC